jgi:hypothetical protein
MHVLLLTNIQNFLALLSSERATFGQFGLTSSWGTQHSGAVVTGNGSLGVREHGGDVQTSLAFNIHEV